MIIGINFLILKQYKIDFTRNKYRPPSDILITINESEQSLKKRIKVSLAIHLYIEQKVTIGKAAQIAGLSRLEFEAALSDQNITISQLSIDDILGDAKKLM